MTKKQTISISFIGLFILVGVGLSLQYESQLASVQQIDLPLEPVEQEIVEIQLEETDQENEVKIKEAKAVAILPAAVWVPQTFNNCGPASTAMILQHFGYQVSQEELKTRMRTNPDDKSVPIYEISEFLESDYGVHSKLLYNGDIATIKLLIANGYYVMVKAWLHQDEDIGHNLIIRGYDDTKGVLIADDSYLGLGKEMPYQEFDQRQWKAFNRAYLPVYDSEDEEKVLKAIIGSDWDKEAMYLRSIEVNLVAVEKDDTDMHSWFNIGTSYFNLGEFQKAKEAFEKSQTLGWPSQMLWYQYEPIKNYNALGEYQKALDLVKIGLTYNQPYAELHYEAAVAYQGLGNQEQALEEIELALKYAPKDEQSKKLKQKIQ